MPLTGGSQGDLEVSAIGAALASQPFPTQPAGGAGGLLSSACLGSWGSVVCCVLLGRWVMLGVAQMTSECLSCPLDLGFFLAE